MTTPTNEAAEPRTEAGRRLFTDNEPMDMFESDGVTWADIVAIERDASEAAPSPDLRAVLERLVETVREQIHPMDEPYDALWSPMADADAALAAPSLLQERDPLTPYERQTLAQHQEDGNGGCIVCREWIIGTHDDDTEHTIMAWPCPVVRLSQERDRLDVERLHQMRLGCDEGCFYWGGDPDGMPRSEPGPIHSKQAAEYARLATTPTAEEPTDA